MSQDDLNNDDTGTRIRRRLRARERLVGTWVKTPSSIICEVLAQSGLDLLVLDAEHAPFDREALDRCTAILRALGMPAFVRVPSPDPAHILSALDSGAVGVFIPHVASVAAAEIAVRAAHYGPGGRGYSGSTRAAGFAGRPITDQLRRARGGTSVIVQIEDLEALEVIDAIAAVEGVDALFIGRIDLTVALGASDPDDPRVVAAVARICAAGRARSVPVGMFLADPAETKRWTEQGASLFVLGSDQGFVLSGARALAKAVR